MRDSLNRRLREKRQPSDKGYRLTDRDIEILKLLYRYRMLTSKDLIRYFNPKSPKRFTERLGLLFHDAGLLDRPKEQWQQRGASYAHISYALSSKGKRLLADQDKLPHQAVIYPQDRKQSASPQFQHALKISQTLLKAEIETHNQLYQRFVPLGEIRARQLAKGKAFKLEIPATIPISKDNPLHTIKTTIKPDGLYGIEYRSENGKPGYRFYAIEIEHTSPERRNNLHLSSTHKKKLAYKQVIKSGVYKEVLGVPCLELNFSSE